MATTRKIPRYRKTCFKIYQEAYPNGSVTFPALWCCHSAVPKHSPQTGTSTQLTEQLAKISEVQALTTDILIDWFGMSLETCILKASQVIFVQLSWKPMV